MATRSQIQRLKQIIHGDTESLPKSILSASRELHSTTQTWLSQRGVQGIGIGRRQSGGQERGELTLKVYVEKKLPAKEAEVPIPRAIRLPGSSVEVGIDIQEVGRIKLQNALRRRMRPALGGCSVSLENGIRGTFGCLVRRRNGPLDRFYILSSSHVIGDYGLATPGAVVFQPGTSDRPPSTQTRLGRYTRSVTFRFTSVGFPNLCDAAVARVPMPAVRPAIYSLAVPTGVNYLLRRGMRVQLVGSTSERTRGRITDIDHDVAFDWKTPNGGIRRAGFGRQVACPAFTQDGDSGAVVLDTQGRVVGLHFAGSEGLSIFNRIGPIEDQLGVEVVTRQNLDLLTLGREDWATAVPDEGDPQNQPSAA